MWGCCKLLIHPKWNDTNPNHHFQKQAYWNDPTPTQSSNGYFQGCSKCGGAASYWSIQSGTIHKTTYCQPHHQTDTFKDVLGVGMLQAFDPSKVERSKKRILSTPSSNGYFQGCSKCGGAASYWSIQSGTIQKTHIANPNHQTDTFKDVLSVGVLQAIDPSKVERS